MNGAEALLRTSSGPASRSASPIAARPKMHFVAALDQVLGMRLLLALFEG
jgi:hypothetical protein